MCGINGIIRFNREVLKEEIDKMNKAIKHRGPDDEGVFISNSEGYCIGLGHVRLAILDLSEKGHQPMGYNIEEDKIIYRDDELDKADIIIVYNGEVYNYLELKKKFNLETETGTDTEIILKLYNKLGFECVKEFNGMWAFCIFDKIRGIIFCSRDRLGVKPFYYYWNGEEFIFSSELKGILAVKEINKKENINKEAVELYFALGFIPSPYSIYKNTFKLEARQNLIFDLNKKRIEMVSWFLWDNFTLKPKTTIKVSHDEKCPVCGMFVYKYPRWAAQIWLKNGKHFSFDGVKDLTKYIHSHPKLNIDKIVVTDYYKQYAIDGKKAFYVIGSDVYGPMGEEAIPFEDEDDAKAFMRDHRGKKIVSFVEIELDDK